MRSREVTSMNPGRPRPHTPTDGFLALLAGAAPRAAVLETNDVSPPLPPVRT